MAVGGNGNSEYHDGDDVGALGSREASAPKRSSKKKSSKKKIGSTNTAAAASKDSEGDEPSVRGGSGTRTVAQEGMKTVRKYRPETGGTSRTENGGTEDADVSRAVPATDRHGFFQKSPSESEAARRLQPDSGGDRRTPRAFESIRSGLSVFSGGVPVRRNTGDPDALQIINDRRVRKWMNMIGDTFHDFEHFRTENPKKVKSRCRKGIPDEFRGVAWYYLSGGRSLRSNNMGVYEQLTAIDANINFNGGGGGGGRQGGGKRSKKKSKKMPSSTESSSSSSSSYDFHIATNRDNSHDPDATHGDEGSGGQEHIIIRDLTRTFPTHSFYSERHGAGQRALFNVLRAISIYNVSTGYVQGMGFIVAVLLLYMSEEEAFWTFIAMLRGDVGGTGRIAKRRAMASAPGVTDAMDALYAPGMPLLKQYLDQFEYILKRTNPTLAAHMEEQCAITTMYASQYFLTLMTYDLPFDLLLRVWDIFFSEGMKTVFRVGIALFQREEDALMTLTFEHLVGRIKQMPTDIVSSPTTPDEESQNVHNIDVLIRDAMSVKMSDLLRESATQYLSSH